jgi:regulator of sigma E protease
MQTLITSLIVLGIIIFVHEFGHYIVAKATGIRVEEFALGMGPKLAGVKRGETFYSIRVLPLGGYCKMSGETGNSSEYETAAIPDPRRFDQKPVWVRMAVIVAGPLMNLLLAILLFIFAFSIIGIPVDYTTKIGTVIPNSAAHAAGLKPGDKVVSINGESIESWRGLINIIHPSSGVELTLAVEREQSVLEFLVIPKYDEQSKVGIVGISPQEPIIKRSALIDGIKEGWDKTYEITRLTLSGLKAMISGRASPDDIAGPVGIIQIIGESAQFGFLYLINIAALISINLGLLNLLPIPALDGSRLLFLLFEALRGRPVNPNKENIVHLVGFFILMAMLVLFTYNDLARIFG